MFETRKDVRNYLLHVIQQRKKDKETFNYIPDADTKTDIVVSFYDEKIYGLTEATAKARTKLEKTEESNVAKAMLPDKAEQELPAQAVKPAKAELPARTKQKLPAKARKASSKSRASSKTKTSRKASKCGDKFNKILRTKVQL